MTGTVISAVGCVSNGEGLNSKTRFTKPGCRKYRPHFRLVSTLLEMSVATQVKKNKHKSSTLRLEQVGAWGGTAKTPSFRSSNSPVADMHSISLTRYWFIVVQRHHIPMRELENGVTRGKPEVPSSVWYQHAAASLKAVLHFDCVNTSGQKPCILRAHFTQAYWALDTLPNRYY